MGGVYKAKEFTPPKTDTGLECSMDGFVKMVKELALSMKYLWDGTMGLGNWMGYALAAGYYIGMDLGVGETTCEIFGYGYYLIDGLHYLVDFAGAGEKKEASKPAVIPKVADSTTKAAAATAKTEAKK